MEENKNSLLAPISDVTMAIKRFLKKIVKHFLQYSFFVIYHKYLEKRELKKIGRAHV